MHDRQRIHRSRDYTHNPHHKRMAMDDTSRLIAYRKWQDRLFQVVGGLCTLIGIATLVARVVNGSD